MKIAVNFSLLLMIVILLGCAENPKKSSHADVNQADNVFVEVSIEGMSCMACVAKVKKTLSDLNKNATIQYNPNNIALDKIKQAIDEIGYNAGAVKTLSQ